MRFQRYRARRATGRKLLPLRVPAPSGARSGTSRRTGWGLCQAKPFLFFGLRGQRAGPAPAATLGPPGPAVALAVARPRLPPSVPRGVGHSTAGGQLWQRLAPVVAWEGQGPPQARVGPMLVAGFQTLYFGGAEHPGGELHAAKYKASHYPITFDPLLKLRRSARLREEELAKSLEYLALPLYLVT